MTAIQATMFQAREAARTNRAREQETARSNLAQELERNRANRAVERLRSDELAARIARDTWERDAQEARTELERDKYDQDNVRYWVDAFGFGPNARDDFATVFTRGIGGGSQRAPISSKTH